MNADQVFAIVLAACLGVSFVAGLVSEVRRNTKVERRVRHELCLRQIHRLERELLPDWEERPWR